MKGRGEIDKLETQAFIIALYIVTVRHGPRFSVQSIFASGLCAALGMGIWPGIWVPRGQLCASKKRVSPTDLKPSLVTIRIQYNQIFSVLEDILFSFSYAIRNDPM